MAAVFHAFTFKRGLQLLTTLGLILWVALAHATPVLDLWGSWQLAQQRDPIYAAQQAKTQANQEQINQAKAALLPRVDAVSALRHNEVRRASNLQQSQHQTPSEWQLRFSQPLLDLSALAQFERSRYVAGMAVLDVELARNELFLRLSQAYFDVLTAQDSLQSLAAEKTAIEQQLRLAEYEFELGGATITDTYEAQSRLDLVINQRISTENSLQAAKNQLSRIVGQPIYALAPLNPNAALPAPEPLQLDAWLSQAATNSLVIAKAGLAVQAQQQQLKANQREHAPTLALQAQSGSQSNQGIYGANNGPRALNSSVGIELSIPLYQGGAISSKVRENASLLQQANYEHENSRRATAEDTSTYFVSVNNSLRQVQALQAAEQTSQNAVAANELAHEVGVRTTIDVLNAQKQLYETQRALAKARYDTLLYSIKLKSTVGQLPDEEILALNRLLAVTPY